MYSLIILAVGISIVIGGILAFRLHAFVALILAGVVVAFLTPADLVVRSGHLETTVKTAEFDADAGTVQLPEALKKPQDYLVCIDPGEGQPLNQVGKLDPAGTENDGSVSYKFEAGEATGDLVLIKASDFSSAASTGNQSFINRLKNALGSYCGNLAILIVAASIIGRCLLDSGAADRIVRSALNALGEKRAPLAFVVSGFTLSIPVFFDTVFYLMIPLGKALRLRTGGNYLLFVLCIVAGGTMAHSLVPPTPGPLFIAEAFGVSLVRMIIGGCVVGLFSSTVAMFYAYWANSKFDFDLPEADLKAQAATTLDSDSADGQPGLVASLTPILLPVLLITLGALVEKRDLPESAEKAWYLVDAESPLPASVFGIASVMKTLGEKNLALLVSACFAVILYVKTKKPSREDFHAAMVDAVSSAGTIILVTAAGGAFGRMMRQTSVAETLQGLQGTSPILVCVAAFLVTTAVRTAQGSSTVAMITAAGIFGGLVSSGAAGVDPLYVALAVGCGSKPIAWMNDSGFWVITRMSGMTETEGLKYVTPMTCLAGVAGLVAVIIGVVVFP